MKPAARRGPATCCQRAAGQPILREQTPVQIAVIIPVYNERRRIAEVSAVDADLQAGPAASDSRRRRTV